MLVVASTFFLIFLAEFGDKSQLVCMLLASRHKGLPVFLGAFSAFALLNVLAVMAGATLADLIPTHILTWIVAGLFCLFGVKSLLEKDAEEDEEIEEKTNHSVFITTFLMIFLAELGDKTQLAIAGLSTTEAVIPVYIGATLALGITSLLGIVGGRWLTQRFSTLLLHRISGLLFLAFAIWIVIDNL